MAQGLLAARPRTRARNGDTFGAIRYVLIGIVAIGVCVLAVRTGDTKYVLIALVAVPILVALAHVPLNLAGLLPVGILVLLLVPARNRFAALGAYGTPGSLLGITAFLVWIYGWMRGRSWLENKPQPLRIAAGLFAVSVLISYVLSAYRLKAYEEAKGADRGLMLMGIMIGISLLVADTVRNRRQIRNILRAIVAGGTIIGLLGIIQFFTKRDYAADIKIPGMKFVPFESNNDRSGFSRIVGTVSHPIELSVVLVFALVIALHLVFTEPRESRGRYIACASVLGAAVPMTVSRTGVIALFVAALVLFPAWDRVRRVNMAALALIGIVMMRFAVPGLIGTLFAIFTDSSNDPSRKSRSISLPYAIELISGRPFFGRGMGTYIPTSYRFLDDQILLTVVEIGFVGLITTLLIFWVAIGQTRDVRRLSSRYDDRDLAQTLLACIAVGLTTALTYDAFTFPTGLTVLMVVVGLSGGLWRIVRSELSAASGHPASSVSDSRLHSVPT
jgi:hypothetical protein